MDKYLKHPFAKPPFRPSRKLGIASLRRFARIVGFGPHQASKSPFQVLFLFIFSYTCKVISKTWPYNKDMALQHALERRTQLLGTFYRPPSGIHFKHLSKNLKIRKILVSVKFVCPQFWGRKWRRQFYGRLEKLRSFCRKTSTPVKYLVSFFFLGGGGYLLGFLGGGGSADFVSMGARSFLILKKNLHTDSKLSIPLRSAFLHEPLGVHPQQAICGTPSLSIPFSTHINP